MKTVRRMKQLAIDGQADPDVRRLALRITDGFRGQDSQGMIGAIRGWMSSHIVFTRDPRKHELLITPRILVRSLRNPANHSTLRIDCDDVATLGAALGGAVGLDARFVVVAYLSKFKGAPRHVWAELSPPMRKQWQEVDTTRDFQGLPPRSAIRWKWTLNV